MRRVTRVTSTGRHAAIVGFLLAPALVLAAATASAEPPRGRHVDLYQDGIAVGPDNSLFALPPGAGATYLPGSRVLDPGAAVAVGPAAPDAAASPGAAAGPAPTPTQIAGDHTDPAALLDTQAADAAASASRDWLASGVVPGENGPFAELGESALLDLRALTLDGAVLAAPSPHWRYVWPRDASFAAAAFARTGHVDDAWQVLRFLQEVQEKDGSFQARYLPDGTGVPDDRGTQTDGTGWVLWATGVVLEEADEADRARIATDLAPMIDASTDHALDLTADGGALPPPSSDYWEVNSTALTLGTAAPLLAGLEAAHGIYERRASAGTTGDEATGTTGLDATGLRARAASADRAASRLREAIEREFGDDGYARHVDGGARDAAITFALPPFQPVALDGADPVWRETVYTMLRPAGGLAPGEGWRRDGISWTPQTALYALTAASSGVAEDRIDAQNWLRWIADHRTDSGAIPEKVLADGSPAAVAPLAWSSALVVLTLVELDGAG